MPEQLTYPGVYIDERTSGVHSITGVATSITAFVGRAERGPVEQPILVTSFADFTRRFGGLWKESMLGFAVRDFYDNGGSLALILRLFKTGAGDGVATLAVDSITLRAASPGAWSEKLSATVDHDTNQSAGDPDLFNLTITAGEVTERFRNVTTKESASRHVETVLANESQLAVVHSSGLARPAEGEYGGPTGFNDGAPLDRDSFLIGDANTSKKGLYALRKADLFNLLCIPPFHDIATDGGTIGDLTLSEVAEFCKAQRAVLLVDPPPGMTDPADAEEIAGVMPASSHAAMYFPRIRRSNPMRDNQIDTFAGSGAVAGVIARTDADRGVWKAPAGLEASLVGVVDLAVHLTDLENGRLNQLGVNCLRSMPSAGRVVWGARTAEGSDRRASEWKYLPVRRTALFLEESLYRGTQWIVFEPNDEPLWAQIRLNIGAFMQNLFQQGAFAGRTPREAYFVKCDRETTTPADINNGVVNIFVGFAPLKPAEFVVIRVQQLSGQTAV